MNAVAAELGMTGSHFVDPSGDDAEGQVVTARDMVIAARALLREPVLVSIVAMQRAEVRVGGPKARVIRLENTTSSSRRTGSSGSRSGRPTRPGSACWSRTGPRQAPRSR